MPTAFDAWAMEYFQFQYSQNAVYRLYADSLYTNTGKLGLVSQLPFLPISLFKTQDIRSGQFESALLFESSGTTGMIPSRHWVKDAKIYVE
ncbi:MAG TPA: acyl transferase, partial [Chitinophagaceae bacterium]|nr:acyl transferase [Chitinophagaceae bacterium]